MDNVEFLRKALAGSWRKNTAIASNIANINTPGYKRVVVNFEEELKNQMATRTMNTTHHKHFKAHINPFNPKVLSDRHSFRRDKSAVNIDVENAEMAKNTIYYNVVLNQVNSQFQRLKAAMRINK